MKLKYYSRKYGKYYIIQNYILFELTFSFKAVSIVELVET